MLQGRLIKQKWPKVCMLPTQRFSYHARKVRAAEVEHEDAAEKAQYEHYYVVYVLRTGCGGGARFGQPGGFRGYP
jgi:hypothetical protein